MEIKKETIEYIAKLSKLRFSEEEIESFTQEFESILTHFQNIENEDLEDLPMYLLEEHTGKLRKDVRKDFKDKEALFKNAKDQRDGYLVIPKIME